MAISTYVTSTVTGTEALNISSTNCTLEKPIYCQEGKKSSSGVIYLFLGGVLLLSSHRHSHMNTAAIRGGCHVQRPASSLWPHRFTILLKRRRKKKNAKPRETSSLFPSCAKRIVQCRTFQRRLRRRRRRRQERFFANLLEERLSRTKSVMNHPLETMMIRTVALQNRSPWKRLVRKDHRDRFGSSSMIVYTT